MAKQKIKVIDLVSGIDGSYVRKEPAPGQDGRYIIYYRPPTWGGAIGKPRKIPGNVPLNGFIEVDRIRCADGFGRIVIFSYGDDIAHPPIILNAIKEKVGELIASQEKMRKEYKIKMSAVDAKDRLLKRSEEELLKKRLSALKEHKPNEPTGFGSFARGEY
ncbi:hypothetical protein DRQ25_12895 [Candidatus Fermentibacteria bacterium]|nr:MAG: hypothetical protein DRQ25_12895 [Candidatus Fermentibacteria bacterium]